VWINMIFRKSDKDILKVNIELDEQDEDELVEEIKKESDAPVDAEEKIPKPMFLYEVEELQGRFDPEVSMIVEILGILGGPLEAGSIDEAYHHSDIDSRTKWRR
jgi:hypothetical protein